MIAMVCFEIAGTCRPIRPLAPLGKAAHRKLALRMLHGIRKARLRGTRAQWLLLAFMWRPARQPKNIEGGADATVRIGETLGVNFRHPHQRRASQRRAPTL